MGINFSFRYYDFKIPIPWELFYMDLAENKSQPARDKKTMITRTAILWGNDDLFEKGIESILTASKNWKVINLINDRDVATLAREVEKINPQIVIVNLSNSAGSLPVPIQAMEDSPELKIITINPRNNRIEVYDRQVICIKEMSELITIIEKHSDFTSKEVE